MANVNVRADENALRGIMDQYKNLWNKADVKGLTGLFMEGAEFISSLGIRARGRKAIEDFYTQHLLKGEFKGTQIEVNVDSVKAIGENVGLVSSEWRILRDGNLVRNGYGQCVCVRENGKWLYDSFQATFVEEKGRAAA